MLKNILKLDGAEGLSKKEQLNIIGATGRTPPHQTACIWAVEICRDGSIYDPCQPLTEHNFMC
ncbi:hypothetical protein NAT51_11240 [Flavobacterium amniphilum]|uniref:hypothetical protein n=1 Tax=Flavobacterium amniphilum TaxID=1834035 RepID=UPI002029B9A8|nr:hypothetical protein [Flavobacterium amniphilum]MCL9806102.1 hypothetical protein [Flavobacterium amniphilum]